jgi:hypothetical protein
MSAYTPPPYPSYVQGQTSDIGERDHQEVTASDVGDYSIHESEIGQGIITGVRSKPQPDHLRLEQGRERLHLVAEEDEVGDEEDEGENEDHENEREEGGEGEGKEDVVRTVLGRTRTMRVGWETRGRVKQGREIKVQGEGEEDGEDEDGDIADDEDSGRHHTRMRREGRGRDGRGRQGRARDGDKEEEDRGEGEEKGEITSNDEFDRARMRGQRKWREGGGEMDEDEDEDDEDGGIADDEAFDRERHIHNQMQMRRVGWEAREGREGRERNDEGEEEEDGGIADSETFDSARYLHNQRRLRENGGRKYAWPGDEDYEVVGTVDRGVDYIPETRHGVECGGQVVRGQ